MRRSIFCFLSKSFSLGKKQNKLRVPNHSKSFRKCFYSTKFLTFGIRIFKSSVRGKLDQLPFQRNVAPTESSSTSGSRSKKNLGTDCDFIAIFQRFLYDLHFAKAFSLTADVHFSRFIIKILFVRSDLTEIKKSFVNACSARIATESVSSPLYFLHCSTAYSSTDGKARETKK